MKSVDWMLSLFMNKAYLTYRVDAGYSVKQTSLRVPLPVRTIE